MALKQPKPESDDPRLKGHETTYTARSDAAEAEACRCPHPADEHSVYGCADDCACEWMPRRPRAAGAES